MIREHRVLTEPSDITHVRLTCRKCQRGTVLYDLSEHQQRPPPRCYSCGADWWEEFQEHPNTVPELGLIRALQRLRECGRPVRTQLESLDTPVPLDRR